MLKHFATALVIIATSVTASAQGLQESQNRMKLPETDRPQFADFAMRGLMLGLEYGSLDGEAKVTIKNSATGATSTASSSTNESTGMLGVSMNYAHLPRKDFGLMFGGTILKKLESNSKTSSSSLSTTPEMLQIRPDVNAAYTLNNGLYGAVGVNLSVLSMDQDMISKVGFGLQAQVGFVPTRNLALDIGYVVSRHHYNNMYVASGSTKLAELDSNESYVDFKQLRGRISYLF